VEKRSRPVGKPASLVFLIPEDDVFRPYPLELCYIPVSGYVQGLFPAADLETQRPGDELAPGYFCLFQGTARSSSREV